MATPLQVMMFRAIMSATATCGRHLITISNSWCRRSLMAIWAMYSGAVENPFSYAHFLVKWNEVAPHVKRATKGKDGFCQCDVCYRIKRLLMLTSTPAADRALLQSEMEAHNMYQMANRARYALHQAKAARALRDAAREDEARLTAASEAEEARLAAFEHDDDDGDDEPPPLGRPGTDEEFDAREQASERARRAVAAAAAATRVAGASSQTGTKPTCPKVVSMTADCGSSQKMGTLPSFGTRPPKRYAEKAKLSCKAMGLMIHGIWRAMLLFPGNVPHGASMTCETIFIGLKKLEEKYGSLPETLYIQLDNCSDNKSKTVLAFLYDLRRRGILDKVTTCMLIVGHTHIDIDQWFGVFSRALTRDDALSLPGYARVLKSAFKLQQNAPETIQIVDVVHDWDSFYSSHIDRAFENFSQEKCFKCMGDENDDTRLFYKHYMISKETLPRPYQRGDIFLCSSEAVGASVFGMLWESATDEEKQKVLKHNWKCGDAVYDRKTRRWATEIEGAPGALLKAPSLGIKLLVSEPIGDPAVMPVPESWYRSVDGNRHSNAFSAIERTINGMIDDGFFENDSVGMAWWKAWFTDHRPREDGECTARDVAKSIPFTWPRSTRTCPPSGAPPPREAPQPTQPPAADPVRYSGYGRAQQRRANAHLEEDHPMSKELKVVVGQIVVLGYRYDTDAATTKRLALAKIVSVKRTGPKRVKVQWLCRAGRNVNLYAFSVTGKFREATPADFKRRRHRGKWTQATKDEHKFDVDMEDVMCALCKTKQGCDDIPVSSLNRSGTIPNFRLATGLSLHEYITSVIHEQEGVVSGERHGDDNDGGDDHGDGDSDGDRGDGGDGDDNGDDDARSGDDSDVCDCRDLVLEIRVAAWTPSAVTNALDPASRVRRTRILLAKILEHPDGEGLLTTAGMCPLPQFREFAAGSAPQEGLMGLIRGRVPLDTAELRHTAIFRSEYTKIGHDADAADLET